MFQHLIKPLRAILPVAAVIAASLLTAMPATAAENCKKVYIQVTNNTGDKVKIIDLDYFDYGLGKNGRWRSEPIKNEVIRNGQVWQATRRLEKVNAEKTKIRIKYRKPKKFGVGTFGMTVHKSKTSDVQTCKKESQFIFDLK